jgi:hypothetical protein
VGGTREADDWCVEITRGNEEKLIVHCRYPLPRPETKHKILETAVALCPSLAPPEVRAVREPTVEDVLPFVVEEGCGLRPARKGGIRLEVEWFKRGSTSEAVPVVHNYG